MEYDHRAPKETAYPDGNFQRGHPDIQLSLSWMEERSPGPPVYLCRVLSLGLLRQVPCPTVPFLVPLCPQKILMAHLVSEALLDHLHPKVVMGSSLELLVLTGSRSWEMERESWVLNWRISQITEGRGTAVYSFGFPPATCIVFILV